MSSISIISYFKKLCQSLSEYYAEDEAKAIARILLQKVTGEPFHQILANGLLFMSTSQLEKMDGYLSQLKLQKPIQYIIGETEFFGITLQVTPDVLIPRPETEELVDWVIKSNKYQRPSILDIGTGSGCIAIALAKNIPKAKVHAIDISTQAIALAKKNAAIAGVEINLNVQDILKLHGSIPGTPFDIIVSNPPYVRESEKAFMHRNVLQYEPQMALFVNDNDPLIYYHAIAKYAKDLLKPEGLVYCEINEALGKETSAIFKTFGFEDVEIRKDINGKDRMIKVKG